MIDSMKKLSALTALIVVSPALASAQTVGYSTKSPVAITSFHVTQTYLSGASGGELVDPPQFVANGIALSFVNNDSATITSVTFAVDDGQGRERIVDKGTFRPGARIRHTFAVDGGISGDLDATCTVEEVGYADGRVWRKVTGDAATQ